MQELPVDVGINKMTLPKWTQLTKRTRCRKGKMDKKQHQTSRISEPWKVSPRRKILLLFLKRPRAAPSDFSPLSGSRFSERWTIYGFSCPCCVISSYIYYETSHYYILLGYRTKYKAKRYLNYELYLQVYCVIYDSSLTRFPYTASLTVVRYIRSISSAFLCACVCNDDEEEEEEEVGASQCTWGQTSPPNVVGSTFFLRANNHPLTPAKETDDSGVYESLLRFRFQSGIDWRFLSRRICYALSMAKGKKKE